MIHSRSNNAPILLTLGLAALASCSGSDTPVSTSESVTALAGPAQVAVVGADAPVGGGSGATAGGHVAPGAGGYPSTSDYITDSARVYIYDPSMQSLDTVNSILCQTSNTAYSQMVNQGAYTAQIDVDSCETGGSGDSDSGQSSGGAGNLEIFTVRCARASNGAAQTVHFWVPSDMDGSPETIFADMSLTRGASASDPFGTFSLSFANVPDSGGDINDPQMQGVLKTTDAGSDMLGFTFFNDMGDIDAVHTTGEFSRIEEVAVEMDTSMEAGIAHVRTRERYNFGGGDSGIETTEWTLAFDATHIKRQLNSETPVILSREDYETMAWRYNLYYATGDTPGARVELNSGFGFRTAGDEYGWIGYHGMWAPEGVTIATGDTITKDEYGSDEVETFTVLQAPGKLVKNTRNTMDLVDLSGQTFTWWDFNVAENFLMDYDGSDWRKTATWNDSTYQWDALGGGPVVIDVTSYAGGWLDMWADSLGGRVNYVDGESFITFYAQEIMTASSDLFSGGTTATLYGFTQCLGWELSASDVETGSVYLADQTDVNTPHEYVFDQTDLTLYFDNPGDTLRQVGLATGEVPTSGPNEWGMNSGPMVENTAGLTGIGDIWSVSVFYTYETGHNTWNKLTAIKDSDLNPVSFDAPLQFTYTHATENDRNEDSTYDGQLYFLEYNGPGNLHGIPHDPSDIDGDGQPDRWYPRFSLEDGTLMGPGGVEYAIRASEMEQSLQVAGSGGGSLDLSDASSLTLPDGSFYVTPTNGDKPTVTGPPAVIDGVVQGE